MLVSLLCWNAFLNLRETRLSQTRVACEVKKGRETIASACPGRGAQRGRSRQASWLHSSPHSLLHRQLHSNAPRLSETALTEQLAFRVNQKKNSIAVRSPSSSIENRYSSRKVRSQKRCQSFKTKKSGRSQKNCARKKGARLIRIH